MPNTAKYTMMKATSEAPTAGAASGDADSAVRISPYTVNGCRPTSVVIHPAITATNPAGPMSTAKRFNVRHSYSLPRQRASRLHAPSANISTPRPTMMRNVQNTTRTGGRSAAGIVSSPASGASRSCLRIKEDQRGICSG
jgi:hypothetical protein